MKATEDLLEEFDALDVTEGGATETDYNVAPTTGVRIVVTRVPHGQPKTDPPVRQLRVARWGLVPSWAKDLSIGNKMINARAESVADKPAFAKAFATRRCLLPADGWYEWQRIDGADGKPAKQPFLMCRPDGRSLALAGLYEFWKPKDDPAADLLLSVTIVTVPSAGELAEIHDRMPLAIAQSDWTRWLDPAAGGPAELLQPGDEAAREQLELRPVSDRVNNVANNAPDLLDKVQPALDAQQLF